MTICRHSLIVLLFAVIASLVSACATTAQAPATPQPALAAVVQPYADAMRKAGIQSVQVYGNGARARVATYLGDVYVRYPAGLAPTAFAVYVEPTAVEVDSDTYNAGNSAQYEAAIKAILPLGIRLANENGARIREQRELGKN
jgi:hypothetical protein